jgi:hypothetical protein
MGEGRVEILHEVAGPAAADIGPDHFHGLAEMVQVPGRKRLGKLPLNVAIVRRKDRQLRNGRLPLGGAVAGGQHQRCAEQEAGAKPRQN